MKPTYKLIAITSIAIIAVLAIVLVGILIIPNRQYALAPPNQVAKQELGLKSEAPAPQLWENKKEASPSGADNLRSAIPSSKIALKIIKTAEIRFQVKNIGKSLTAIKIMAKDSGGYLASENSQNYDNQIENTIVIRVPVERFDQLMQSLNSQAIFVDHKNIQAQDVTAEFVDTEARLKAKRAVEERYLAILRQAKTVQDILDVESRLGTIREEIETVEGRLKYLNDQIGYSTITLTIYQTVHQQNRPENSFWKQIGSALVGGWNGFLAVLIGLATLWPLIIVLVAGIWFYRKYFTKNKNSGIAS